MPLKPGKSKVVLQSNIEKLIHEKYEPKQAAAIAYAKAGLSKKKPKKPKMPSY